MNSYRILALKANSIYAQTLKNGEKTGYRLEEDDKYYKRFRHCLDASLDTIQLEEVYKKYKKVFKNSKFSFKDEKGFDYTLMVIDVVFNGVYEDKRIEDEKEREKTRKTQSQLREILYKNGFNLDGNHYVRYKRSAASSRVGKCLFIREELLKKMEEWSNCGIKPEKKDYVAFEAYKALSLSSIIGTINIPIDHILFVDDQKSRFKDNVIVVKKNNDGGLYAEETEYEIENDIWDGESLLDESRFKDSFKDKHMLLLRNKFFKTCAFKTKIKKWFKDNKIETVDKLKELGCVTLAENVDDIDLITTPNSLKYLKFVGGLSEENIQLWKENVDDTFGVVKYDKRTRFFNGRMVQTSYQFLNTIQLSEKDADKLLSAHGDFITLVRNDPAIMKYYFTHLVNREKEELVEQKSTEDTKKEKDAKENIIEKAKAAAKEAADEKEGEHEDVERSNVIFNLISSDKDFCKTQLFYDLRNDIVSSFRDNLREGHLLLHGTNATLFGNGPALLRASIGIREGTTLREGEIRCERFENGAELVCARSPHITMGNLFYVTNVVDEHGIWDYFDLGKDIVCVNAYGDNIQQRLNGCDYDSDTMLITDDPLIVAKTRENYELFKVPVCGEKPTDNEIDNLYEIDSNMSTNCVGEIVNLSQILNSKLWNLVNSGTPMSDAKVKDLYKNICILAVLSGMEIDKAKRDYGVRSKKVLQDIRTLYEEELDTIPMFFKKISEKYKDKKRYEEQSAAEAAAAEGAGAQETNDETEESPAEEEKSKKTEDKKPKKEKQYVDHLTSMDFIYNNVIKHINFNKGRKTLDKKPLSEIFVWDPSKKMTRNDYNLCDKIDKIIENMNKINNALNGELREEEEEASKDVILENIEYYKNELDKAVNKLLRSEAGLRYLLKKKEDNNDCSWASVSALLQKNNKVFNDLLERSKKNNNQLEKVVETPMGDIILLDYRFKKVNPKK